MHIDTTDLDSHHSLDADTPSLVITNDLGARSHK